MTLDLIPNHERTSESFSTIASTNKIKMKTCTVPRTSTKIYMEMKLLMKEF